MNSSSATPDISVFRATNCLNSERTRPADLVEIGVAMPPRMLPSVLTRSGHHPEYKFRARPFPPARGETPLADVGNAGVEFKPISAAVDAVVALPLAELVFDRADVDRADAGRSAKNSALRSASSCRNS